MKAKKLFWALAATFAALSMTVAISSCEPKDNGGNNNDNPLDNIEEEEELALPKVDAPGEGNTTVVLYIPQSDCEEAEPYILGILSADDGEGKWSNELDRALESAGNGWWKVTIPTLTDAATNFKFRMDDGANGWSMEPKGSYELLEDAADYLKVKEDETNNLVAIANCDNKVLYIKSGKWSSTPCAAPVPGGKAKFIFTLKGENPGKDIIFTGNFAENAWDTSDRVMTKEADGTYSWEGDYPENFRFKVIVFDAAGIGNANDKGQLWMAGDDIAVEAESGNPIKFEGCFDGLCPEEPADDAQ